jgi:hypothetical protein
MLVNQIRDGSRYLCARCRTSCAVSLLIVLKTRDRNLTPSGLGNQSLYAQRCIYSAGPSFSTAWGLPRWHAHFSRLGELSLLVARALGPSAVQDRFGNAKANTATTIANKIPDHRAETRAIGTAAAPHPYL